MSRQSEIPSNFKGILYPKVTENEYNGEERPLPANRRTVASPLQIAHT
jgi:hypothetical protein